MTDIPERFDVDPNLQRTPEQREGYAYSYAPVRFHPYKPEGQRQMKRKGRWQSMNEYGGWHNCPTPTELWSAPPDYRMLREELRKTRNAALREAASIASNACLVPPDGGSPTQAEADVCDEARRRILALIEKDAP